VLGTQLENVQPVSPKTVEPGVVRKFRRARINCHHVQGVVDVGPGSSGRGKGNLHVVVRPLFSVKTLSLVAERQPLARVRSNSQRPLVGQVQKRREADASVLINEAKKCRMINAGVEIQHQRRCRACFGIGRIQMYLLRREFKSPRRRGGSWCIGGPIFEPLADAPYLVRLVGFARRAQWVLGEFFGPQRIDRKYCQGRLVQRQFDSQERRLELWRGSRLVCRAHCKD